MRARYGLDAYGRYVNRSGWNQAVEPFPYLRGPRDVWYKLQARADMARWWFSRITGRNWEA